MKDLRELAAYGIVHPTLGPPTSKGGAYMVPCPRTGMTLGVIASNGGGWDHVSVSLQSCIPNWIEMEYVKRMFFRADEWAMQLHAPPSDHVNIHPYCLHLWRPHDLPIPIPPVEFV